jgi:hypothetical protein
VDAYTKVVMLQRVREESAQDEDSERRSQVLHQHHHQHCLTTAIDTRVVQQWKILTLSVLLLSTLAIALGVYSYTNNNERREFETQFHQDADKVMEDLGTKLDFSLAAVDELVVSFVVSKVTQIVRSFQTLVQYLQLKHTTPSMIYV